MTEPGAPDRKIVILQPGFLPWLGFFDLMLNADVFVIFDDVQYTVRDWRNRNRIKTPGGILWLTVPVKGPHLREKLIRDIEIDTSQDWRKNHLRSLETFYKKAACFEEIRDLLREIYDKDHMYLIDADMDFMLKIQGYLSIGSDIVLSSEIPSTGKKDEKLLSICKHLHATHYLSGDAARDYLREPLFASERIVVQWHDYSHPYYSQLWMREQGFISHLSIVDLLFNHGPDSLAILSGRTKIPPPGRVKVRHANDV